MSYVVYLFQKIKYSSTNVYEDWIYMQKHILARQIFISLHLTTLSILVQPSLYHSTLPTISLLRALVPSCDVCHCARTFHADSIHSEIQFGTVIIASMLGCQGTKHQWC